MIVFLPLIFSIAFLYSSIGHGGASGYLALMALFNINHTEMRSSALLLNIFVSGIAFIQFYRSGNFRVKLFFPFIILSVPLAFTGANINLDARVYKIILGICLAVAAFRIIGILGKKNVTDKKQIKFFPALLIGGAIGFISGIIGIGGGILLSPILILLLWADLKEAAAISSIFIFINSIAGLTGIIYNGAVFSDQIVFWILAAITGGLMGAYFGSRVMNNLILRYLLFSVLIFASVKLIVA